MEFLLSNRSTLRLFDFETQRAIAAAKSARAAPIAPKTPIATMSFLQLRGSICTLGSRDIYQYNTILIFFQNLSNFHLNFNNQ